MTIHLAFLRLCFLIVNALYLHGFIKKMKGPELEIIL
jgi:hypothetical protein